MGCAASLEGCVAGIAASLEAADAAAAARLGGGGLLRCAFLSGRRNPQKAHRISLTPEDRERLAPLRALDKRIIEVVRKGHIRMLDADYLRSGKITKMLRRQDMPKEAFLAPEVAAAHIEEGLRKAGGLTYGWQCCVDPDPTGAVIKAVIRFLKSPEGQHITCLFWDFSSLWQNPRSEEQDTEFGLALDVMAYLYASPVGTTVLRFKKMPPVPPEMAKTLAVFKVDAGAEADLRAALERAGVAGAALEYVGAKKVWQVVLASAEAAEAALGKLGSLEELGLPAGAFACTWFNAAAYDGRGWCSLESGVSTEAIARARFYPQLKKAMDELPAKMWEIDGEAPVEVVEQDDAQGHGPRVAAVRAQIEAAKFTGKGDRATVLRLFNDFVTHIGNAMIDSGEAQQGEYEGEYNAAGEREGRGVYRFADGDVYDGEFKAGKAEGRGVYRYASGSVYDGEYKADNMEGRGVFRYADGAVYDGEYKAGKEEGRGVKRYASGSVYDGEYKAGLPEGRGVYRFANGNVVSVFFKQEAPVGEGVKWMADGQQAVRLRDGKAVELISLEEARQTAERLGLPLPSPLPGAA